MHGKRNDNASYELFVGIKHPCDDKTKGILKENVVLHARDAAYFYLT